MKLIKKKFFFKKYDVNCLQSTCKIMFINLRHFPSKLSVLKLAFVLKMLEVLTFILNLIFKDMYIEDDRRRSSMKLEISR